MLLEEQTLQTWRNDPSKKSLVPIFRLVSDELRRLAQKDGNIRH